MGAREPAVVAVVVASDPGEWFETALSSLAAQDYEELSVLVVVPGGTPDPQDRVAATLPGAFVRHVEARSWSGAVNEILPTVEGVAFFVLCHDDVALDRDAVRLLVEESFRSNAGIVSPKVTRWDAPHLLLHVGQGADKTGALIDRVHDGEVDHGQHDGVRDVFVAPGGCTLVRADLLREIGGFDPQMTAIGEDLDMCWRAQLAGARIVVAPQARVRHLACIAAAIRQPPPDRPGRKPPAIEQLRRRHELRTVLKCYGWAHLLRVLPQALALSAGETIAALVTGDGPRATAVAGAWSWNARRAGELRRLRQQVRAQRVVRDAQVRRLQARGSVRLAGYLIDAAQQGLEIVRGAPRGPGHDQAAHETAAIATAEIPGAEPELTGSVGGAFSDDASFDELDETTRVHRPPPLSTQRSRLVVWLLATAFLLVGSRQLLTGGFPELGQFLPLPSWSSAWQHFFAGWQPAGLGTTAPATPAFAELGVVGTVLFGGMGLVQKVLVLACLPVGAWGVARALRPLCSARFRLVAGLAYLGLPLAYDALAQGRWDGLVAFAATPWILARLARAGGAPPYGPPPGWRGTLLGQMLTLGVLEAVAVAFAPAVVVVVGLAAVAFPLGSLLVGSAPRAARTLGVAGGATLVAVVLCAPWSIGVLAAGGRSVAILGLPGASWSAPSWSQLLRFDVGPSGASVLSWLLLAAAVLPLLVARGTRLAWAARLWTSSLLAWVLAWVVVRGWTAPFAPVVEVLLAPAACGVAASIGIGLSAFEHDLTRYRFGWRQVATLGALGATALGVLPVVVEANGGRWGLPQVGLAQPLAWMSGSRAAGGDRVLWLADPRALPGGGFSIQPGLAYATSEGGTPGPSNIWAPAGPGPASRLSQAVQLAEQGRTATFGQLIAPAGIRYVVVLETLAPSAPGLQHAASFPPPSQLTSALLSQDDLRVVPGGEGFTVFANSFFIPERAQRPAALHGPSPTALWPGPADLVGWHGVLSGAQGGQKYQGTLRAGPVTAAYAPAGRWHLAVDGRPVRQKSAYGWAAQYVGMPPGRATLSFDAGTLVPMGVALETATWVVLVALLVVARRWRKVRDRDPHQPRTLAEIGGALRTPDDVAKHEVGV